MTDKPMFGPWYGIAEHDPVHAVAAEWFARLQERNVSLEETLEWRRWIAADARHLEAFARIEEVWQESWEMLGKKKRMYRRIRLFGLAASIIAAVLAGSWVLL